MRLCPGCQHEIKEQMRFCPHCGVVLAEANRKDLIGALIDDRYRIERKIGESRFGTLFSGVHVSLELKVTVQVLYSHLFNGPTAQRPFRDSVLAMAAIDHPNIARIRDFGFVEEIDASYLVLEFLDGTPLLERIKEGPFDQVEAADIIAQIASAIQAANEAGVIHSALTPASVWLMKTRTEATQVKVIDLGLFPSIAAFGAAPSYLSPEQCLGREGDTHSDIYSLGIIGYELLAGRTPFQGTSAVEVKTKQINESPVPLRNLRPEISSKLESAIMRALEKDPLKRQPSAGRFAEEVGKGVEERKPDNFRLAEYVQERVEEAHPVFCGRCGEHIDFDVLYCRHCGSRQPSPPSSVVTAVLGYSAPSEAPVAPRSGVPDTRPLYLDENVQFTVYRPRTVRPLVWSTLLAFAHLAERRSDAPKNEPDPLEEVQRQAEQLLGERIDDYQKTIQDSSQAIPREGEITFIPTAPGIEFNPPSRTFQWQESVHREDFRLRASSSLDGQTARGRLSVFLGSILLAEVTLSIRVDSKQAAEPANFDPASARCYRKIFASYSHLDAVIVDQFQHFAQAFGDEYLRDVTHLRAGEVWTDQLERMILAADIFQLFWSTNSMTSKFVRREWEFALSRRQPNFIRPTYWEDPLPAAPEKNLPPQELARLHFQRIPQSILGSKTMHAGTLENWREARSNEVEPPVGDVPPNSVDGSFPSWFPTPASEPFVERELARRRTGEGAAALNQESRPDTPAPQPRNWAVPTPPPSPTRPAGSSGARLATRSDSDSSPHGQRGAAYEPMAPSYGGYQAPRSSLAKPLLIIAALISILGLLGLAIILLLRVLS
jgi:hypothetical protein